MRLALELLFDLEVLLYAELVQVERLDELPEEYSPDVLLLLNE